MSLIQYPRHRPPKELPGAWENGETASLALPQTLNQPRAAGTRRGQRARGQGRGGYVSRRSAASASRPPAPSEAAHVQRPRGPTEPQPNPRTECSPLVPWDRNGDRSTRLPGGICGHSPETSRKERHGALSRSHGCTHQIQERALACRRAPGNPQRGFVALPWAGAAQDANARAAAAALPASFPHSPPRASPSRSPPGT